MKLTFMDAGQLTARLELERPEDTDDGQGGAVRSHVSQGALWARIEPVSAQAHERAGAETARLTHRIWLRFHAGIAAGQRLRKGQRIFAIRAVCDPDETGRYLICHCEEERA